MSPQTQDYGIEDTARKQCRTLGLSPEEAQSFARQATPFTADPNFNKRYEGFVFKVVRRTILSVGLFVDHSPRHREEGETDPVAFDLLRRTHVLLESLMENRSLADNMTDDQLSDTEELIDEIERLLP